jgi:hypothetical protein
LHQSILLIQGPIHEILAEIAQLLVVVEKLSFFESAILKKKLEKNNFFFASFPRKLVNINRIARMGQNFDDYPVFQQIPGMPILSHFGARGDPIIRITKFFGEIGLLRL